MTDDPLERPQPRLRRFLWSPWSAMVVPIFFAARILTAGFDTLRAIGLGWGLFYFVLTLVNVWTRGRVLRWMYDKESHVSRSEQLEESARQLAEGKRQQEESRRQSDESRRQQDESKRQSDEYERWHQESRKQYEDQLARTSRLMEAEEQNLRRQSALLDHAERVAARFEALITRWEADKQ